MDNELNTHNKRNIWARIILFIILVVVLGVLYFVFGVNTEKESIETNKSQEKLTDTHKEILSEGGDNKFSDEEYLVTFSQENYGDLISATVYSLDGNELISYNLESPTVSSIHSTRYNSDLNSNTSTYTDNLFFASNKPTYPEQNFPVPYDKPYAQFDLLNLRTGKKERFSFKYLSPSNNQSYPILSPDNNTFMWGVNKIGSYVYNIEAQTLRLIPESSIGFMDNNKVLLASSYLSDPELEYFVFNLTNQKVEKVKDHKYNIVAYYKDRYLVFSDHSYSSEDSGTRQYLGTNYILRDLLTGSEEIIFTDDTSDTTLDGFKFSCLGDKLAFFVEENVPNYYYKNNLYLYDIPKKELILIEEDADNLFETLGFGKNNNRLFIYGFGGISFYNLNTLGRTEINISENFESAVLKSVCNK